MSTKRGDLCGETARELKDRREGGTVLERVNHPVFDKLWDQKPREPLLRHVAVSFFKVMFFTDSTMANHHFSPPFGEHVSIFVQPPP